MKSLLATSLLLVSSYVHADTYQYQGPSFTESNNFNGTSVSGSFTIDKLGSNLSDVTISPTSWSFTDGQETISSTELNSRSFFDIWTDAEGNITAWLLEVDGMVGIFPQEIQSLNDHEGDQGDYGGDAFGFARTAESGSWTDISQTPEPSTLALFGTGLLGFGGLIRRKLA